MNKTNKNKIKGEWVNIRISPSTKFNLMKLKGEMELLTYDNVLKILIENHTAQGGVFQPSSRIKQGGSSI